MAPIFKYFFYWATKNIKFYNKNSPFKYGKNLFFTRNVIVCLLNNFSKLYVLNKLFSKNDIIQEKRLIYLIKNINLWFSIQFIDYFLGNLAFFLNKITWFVEVNFPLLNLFFPAYCPLKLRWVAVFNIGIKQIKFQYLNFESLSFTHAFSYV